MKSRLYQWYLDDYRDSLRSTSGSWMKIVKSYVNQLHLDDNRDGLRSISGIWMTIGKV